MFVEKFVVGSVIIEICGWKNIQEMSGHVEGLHLICMWKVSLKQENINDVVKCMNHAFRFPVLLKGIRKRKTHMNAMSVTKGMEVGVVIFFSIVTLEILNFGEKLIFNV